MIKQIEIEGIKLSSLGYGCTALTSNKSLKAALINLETAYSNGITHFDVARLYGFGMAESILGKFAKGKRNSITITTKIGLIPQKLPFKNLFLLHLLRSGLRLAGGYKKVAETTNGMAAPLPFSKTNAQESLDTSLRELGSDYVDFLLLHEYDTDAANKAEVVEFLQEQVKLGKIRAFGIGSSYKKLPKNLDDIDKTYKMIQLESSFSAPNLLQFQGHSKRLISTHSIFRDFEKVKALLSKYSPKELGVSINTDTDLINVFLSFSKLHNPSGITIFTSSNNQRIKQNADLWQSNDYSLHQLEELQKKISGALVD